MVPDVIADGGAVKAVDADVVIQGGRGVEHVDDDRGGGHDTAVDGSGRPRSSAALGAAGHDEGIERGPTAGVAGEEGGHGVHRAHPGLGHRQAREPALVAGAGLAVAVKGERLVGHHADFGDNRAGGLGEVDEFAGELGRVAEFVGAAGDEAQGGGGCPVAGLRMVSPWRYLGRWTSAGVGEVWETRSRT